MESRYTCEGVERQTTNPFCSSAVPSDPLCSSRDHGRDNSTSHRQFHIFCRWSPTSRDSEIFCGVLCVCGIYIFFMSFAFVQEKIFRLGSLDEVCGGSVGRSTCSHIATVKEPEFDSGRTVLASSSSAPSSSSSVVSSRRFTFNIFLVFVICVSNTLFSYLYLLLFPPPPPSPTVGASNKRKSVWAMEGVMSPLKGLEEASLRYQILLTSMSYLTAMLSTNYALIHVSYPTQVLLKSAKMVPVVIGGLLLFKKTYPWYDYVSVAVVTTAIAIFNFAGVAQGTSNGSLTSNTSDDIITTSAIATSVVADETTTCTRYPSSSSSNSSSNFSQRLLVGVSSPLLYQQHQHFSLLPSDSHISFSDLETSASSSSPALPPALSLQPLLPVTSYSRTNLWGILFLCVSLLCDGLTGPRLDKINTSYKHISSIQVMLFVNLFAVLFSAVATVAFEFTEPFYFCLENPIVIKYLLVFCISASLGQFCIFFGLRFFGSLYLTFITTTRKFFTVVFSVMWFEHNVSSLQWFCMLLVFGSLSLQGYFSKRGKPSGGTSQQTAPPHQLNKPSDHHNHNHHHHHLEPTTVAITSSSSSSASLLSSSSSKLSQQDNANHED